MTATQERGRLVLLVYIGLTLVTSLLIIRFYLGALGSHQLPTQAVRFLLTAGLFYWLYRGSMVAKWVAVVLLSLGGGLALALCLRLAPPALFGTLLLALLYHSFAHRLIWSVSVNEFLAHQRGATADEPTAVPPPRG